MLKYISIFLVLLMLLCVGTTAYIYMQTKLDVEIIGVQAINATDKLDHFNKDKDNLKSESFVGTVFNKTDIGDAEDYTYLSYNFKIKNNFYLDMDVIEIQIVPRIGDVCQIGDSDIKSLSSHGVGKISASILTQKNIQGVREFVITYYVWGLPFTYRDSYG